MFCGGSLSALHNCVWLALFRKEKKNDVSPIIFLWQVHFYFQPKKGLKTSGKLHLWVPCHELSMKSFVKVPCSRFCISLLASQTAPYCKKASDCKNFPRFKIHDRVLGGGRRLSKQSSVTFSRQNSQINTYEYELISNYQYPRIYMQSHYLPLCWNFPSSFHFHG